MVANRRRGTHLELRIRRLLHAAGLRYQVDARPESRMRVRADIVLSHRKLVVLSTIPVVPSDPAGAGRRDAIYARRHRAW
ncbi:hypothetical protein [Microbacterium sp. NPDC077184]|uniref:hypothetical protein n=1 Tax=Microbacterium sp. NPDC077184 TaxID=3154764 RepID=UPI00341FF674